LARLEEKATDLRKRMADLQAAIAAVEADAEVIRGYLKVRARYEASAQLVEPTPPAPVGTPASEAAGPPGALTPESPYYGKSFAEAAAVLVRQHGPMTEEEIVEGLRREGVPMVSANPIVNLRMAARRRPDILANMDGRWMTVESQGTDRAPPSTGCVPNRDREFHMAQSLRGLAAARARGVKGGRRPTIPTGTAEEARRLVAPLEEGGEGLSVAEAVDRLGISRSTFYRMVPERKTGPRPEAAGSSPAELFPENEP
jgi:hypothetical protein